MLIRTLWPRVCRVAAARGVAVFLQCTDNGPGAVGVFNDLSNRRGNQGAIQGRLLCIAVRPLDAADGVQTRVG